MFLAEELVLLESLIPKFATSNPKVSKSVVGWHIDHMLKSIIRTCGALEKSNPDDYKWQFNISRFYVLSTKSIPRGSGKAPKSVVAQGEVREEDLIDQLKQAKTLLDMVIKLRPKSNFQHAYFGLINLSESQQYMKIHTRHHLKIIRDILKES